MPNHRSQDNSQINARQSVDAITVDVGIGSDAFLNLSNEWRDLYKHSGCSIFLSWEWMSEWDRSFGAGSSPYLIKTYRGKQLIGIFPLRRVERKVLGIAVTEFRFAGDEYGGADYLDLIAAPGDIQQVRSATMEFLRTNVGFDVLRLENIDADSPTLASMSTGMGGKPRLQINTSTVCPQLDLSGGWEAVLRQGRRANNFRRRLKQLERMPGFEFRSVTAPEQLGEAFERFLILHQDRWASHGGSELSGSPRLISFQRDLMTSMADMGSLRFDELWVGGECRSSVYGMDDGATFYYYNAGYDQRWSRYSVGLVLTGLAIRSAIERGNRTFDFLRGEETYKYDWADKERQLVTATLARPTLAGRTYMAADGLGVRLRAAAKSVLPAPLAEPLKQWRRRSKQSFGLPEIDVDRTTRVNGS